MSSGGQFRRMPSMSRMGMSRGPRPPKPPSTTAGDKPTIVQIVLLLLFSSILGILLFYLHNKQSNASAIKNAIMVVCVMITAIAIAGALHMKINVYDLLISSEINILCLFLFLSYIGVTSIFSLGAFTDIFTYIKNLGGIFIHPTDLFSKGFDIIVPTIFLLIPLMVLVTNFIKASGVNMLGAIAGACITVSVSFAVVFFLWPDDLESPPVGGGDSKSLTSRVADSVSSFFS